MRSQHDDHPGGRNHEARSDQVHRNSQKQHDDINRVEFDGGNQGQLGRFGMTPNGHENQTYGETNAVSRRGSGQGSGGSYGFVNHNHDNGKSGQQRHEQFDSEEFNSWQFDRRQKFADEFNKWRSERASKVGSEQSGNEVKKQT